MKGILFDFDGTLADTLPLCFYAFHEVFKKNDHKALSNEEIAAMFGPSETDIITQHLLRQDRVEDAIADFYHFYHQEHERLAQVNPEIMALLKQLKGAGKSLGIVTGKARKSLEISMERLGMNGLFDVVITGDDVQKPKPDPEGVRLAMSRLNVTKEETVFIGDSNFDIRAGKEAGVVTIGVHWLPTVQSVHFDIPPDYLFTRTDELLELLGVSAKR